MKRFTTTGMLVTSLILIMGFRVNSAQNSEVDARTAFGVIAVTARSGCDGLAETLLTELGIRRDPTNLFVRQDTDGRIVGVITSKFRQITWIPTRPPRMSEAVLKGLRHLITDHPQVAQRVVVCLELKARTTPDGIQILPANQFVRRLCDGELF